MAEVSRIRRTVLRLIALPKASRAWLARSASDKRLRGSWLRYTASQATAWTTASSWGGKKGLTPPPSFVCQDKVSLGPALPPQSYRVGMELHLSGSSGVRQERLLVQEQDKVRTLPQLKRDGALTDQACRLLKECRWENGLVSRGGARHGNHPL